MLRALCILLAGLAGCRQVLGLDDPRVFDASTLHRKAITIRPEMPNATLTNFPVGILLATDAELAASALSDGSDLYFTSAEGDILPHELVTFAAGGELEAWVQIPALVPHAATTIYLYYGGAARIPTSPWSALFAGVWHMSGTGATTLDSTDHAHHASTTKATAVPATAAGLLGSARRYDGVDDALAVIDPSDGSLDFAGSFSWSLWVHVPTSAGAYDSPLAKGIAGLRPGYDIELGSGTWSAFLSDGNIAVGGSFGNEKLDTWVHLTCVVDRTLQRFALFIDDAPVSVTNAMVGSVANDQPLALGLETSPFRGTLDEVRIYTTSITADWVAAEVENAKSRTFVTVGAEE